MLEQPPSALGVLHGRTVGLGDDVRDLPATSVLDCEGSYLGPGFGDAHNHMLWFGMSLREVDLSGYVSLADVYDAVRACGSRLPADAWMIGSGYDHTVIGGHPDQSMLDRAAGGRPVWLKHRSGHQSVVSSALLSRAGVLSHDAGRVPAGSHVVRDADGQATGVLQERAQLLVSQLRGTPELGEMVDAIARAARVYAAEGLTHVVECGIGGGLIGRSPIEALAYQIAREDGLLGVRVDLMPTLDVLHPYAVTAGGFGGSGLDLGLRTGFGDDRLRLGPVKIWLDGSLLGRTAVVSEPFCDESGDLGHLAEQLDVMLERLVAAHRAGWRLAMHAIGDRAVDVALDVVEAAQRRYPRSDVRHRIEHAAQMRPDQLAGMRAADVVPVPQPRFLHDMGDTMLAALGPERADWMYRHRSFLGAGLQVPGSSDRPVANGAPLRGMQSMVQRRSSRGRSIGPGEVVDGGTAWRAYTVDEAWVCHDEDYRGALKRGMLADLVLMSDDPTSVAPSQVGHIDVLATLLGGVATHVSGQFGEESLDRLRAQQEEAS